MKSTVTTTETFKYVLLFTFLFSAFLALAITYNRVFKQKNEIITIIEKYEGISDNSLKIINKYLITTNYSTTGECQVDDYGVKDLNSIDLEKVTDSKEKYLYCLSDKVVTNENADKIYYNIKLFYKFNLPFIGELFTFRITGETKPIKYYSNEQRLS